MQNELERAAYIAGNTELADALARIDDLEQEIVRLRYLLSDNGVDYENQ